MRPETGGAGPLAGATAGSRAHGFADVDDVLFDPDAIASTTRDVRSVQEMLVDVDHQARQLLIDVDGDAAPGLVRGWSEMVHAAAGLWAALPNPPSHFARQERDAGALAIARLVGHATQGTRDPRGYWPGPGPVDSRLSDCAATLQTAGDLVRRYGAEITAPVDPARVDLEVTPARIMHGLYVTAHAVGVALLANGRDRVADSSTGRQPVQLSVNRSRYAVAPLGAWVDRMTTAEILAGAYLRGPVTSPPGAAAQRDQDPGRVARALARWDIQAHRTLAAHPSPVNIAVVSHTQRFIADTAGALLHAGVRPTPDRLTLGLQESARAWHSLTGRWDDLVGPTDHPDPALHRAAAEVRAAYRDITHRSATWSPQTVAAHPDFTSALEATWTLLQASPELAGVITAAAGRPDLVGRARALSLRAHNDVEAGLIANPAGVDPDAVWVSPADILAKRMVPLPTPVAPKPARLQPGRIGRGRTRRRRSVVHPTARPATRSTTRSSGAHHPHPAPAACGGSFITVTDERGNQCEASYCSTTARETRPRSETSRPWPFAHSRTAE